MKRITASTVAIGAALLLALTGCGSDKPESGGDSAKSAPQDPRAALVAAVKKTDERKSARITMRVTAGSASTEAKGVMAFTAPVRGELEMTVPGAGGASEKMKALFTSDAIYIGGGSLASQTGKEWMKLSYADLKQAGGGAFGKLLEQQLSGGQQDPRQYLKLMLASQDLRTVGTEDVNGVKTTHYEGTVDMAKALDDSGQLKELSAAEREALTKQFTNLNLTKVDADIWVDEDGWPVRIEQSGKMTQGDFKLRVDMSDFGVPVNVTAPPASKVSDLGEMLSQLGATPKS